MSISHREAFELFHRGIQARLQFGAGELQADRLQAEALTGLEPGQRAALQSHWAECQDCRQDLALSIRLRREALQRWPLSAAPGHSASEIIQAIDDRRQVDTRLLAPLRLALMIALLVGGVLVLSWMINTVLPRPAGSALPSPTIRPTWTPQPAPTQTEIQPVFTKVEVQPLVFGDEFEMNQWSPDGRYLPIIKIEPSPDQSSDRIYSSLHFFDAQNGQICQSGETQLGNRFEQGSLGWLPDGELLVASQDGLFIYTPCSQQVVDISDLVADQIQAIKKPHRTSDLLLLTGEQAFWIYDPLSREVRQIEGLVPNQSGREHIFAAPSGEAIAISQPAESGSRIYLVELRDGQILEQIDVALGTEQSAAWLDWLLEDVILVYGGPDLSSILMERQPGGQFRMTPVLEDIFGLDASSPREITAQGGYGDPQRDTFHLTLVVRSPQEWALYIYHSDGNRVEKLPYDLDTFLILPNGEAENMFRLEETPSYADMLQVVWIDDATRQDQQLPLLGHTPRNYPLITHAWDPTGQRLVFGSTQGVSLVSIEDGRLLEFWSLAGARDSNYTNLSLSPDGKTLAVQASLANPEMAGPPKSAFYTISLPP